MRQANNMYAKPKMAQSICVAHILIQLTVGSNSRILQLAFNCGVFFFFNSVQIVEAWYDRGLPVW